MERLALETIESIIGIHKNNLDVFGNIEDSDQSLRLKG